MQMSLILLAERFKQTNSKINTRVILIATNNNNNFLDCLPFEKLIEVDH
jgi:hypothetical protein